MSRNNCTNLDESKHNCSCPSSCSQTTSDGQDVHNNRLIIKKQIYAIEGNGSRPSHKGNGYREGAMYTLNTIEQHAVCCFEPGAASRLGGYIWNDVSPTLRASAGDNKPCVISLETFHCQTYKNVGQTLKARDYKDPQCICLPVSIHNNPSACDYHDNGRVSQTLCARMGTGGNNVPLIIEPVPVTLQIRSGKPGGGKGALMQVNKSATLSCKNIQTLFQPMAYGICSKDSNSMKSSNPDSGFYEAKTSRTLDLNGGNPSCNQGGIAVVENVPMAYDIYNEKVTGDVTCPITSGMVHARVIGAIGIDSYNLNVTDGKACTLTSGGASQHNGPRVMQSVETNRDTFNQEDKARTTQEPDAVLCEENMTEAMLWDGSQVCPTLSCSNAGGGTKDARQIKF